MPLFKVYKDCSRVYESEEIEAKDQDEAMDIAIRKDEWEEMDIPENGIEYRMEEQ